MDIQEAHQNWTRIGEDDPMWAVLTDPEKKGGKWSEEQFFQTGRDEISLEMKKLKESGVTIQPGTALDFGCGLGRLSQALSNYFSAVDGVDISASMIEQAQLFNKAPGKVRYHLNLKADLSTFPSGTYDFIFTRICLQHIPPQHQLCYISEFMRVLKPGGVADFHTIHAHGLRALVPNFLTEIYRKSKHRGKPFIPMYGVPAHRVLGALNSAKAVLLRHDQFPYEGWESRFGNDIYVVANKDHPT
jgi:SAM-dependent methyltransferase